MKRSVSEARRGQVATDDLPRTVAESTYQRLRQDILWGRFAPGSPLRSDELRSRYDVGISPLREALTRLTSERLVTSIGQRGFRIPPLTAYDVEDTTRTRIVIEREALASSIENGDIRWETAVVAAFHALSRNPIPNAFSTKPTAPARLAKIHRLSKRSQRTTGSQVTLCKIPSFFGLN